MSEGAEGLDDIVNRLYILRLSGYHEGHVFLQRHQPVHIRIHLKDANEGTNNKCVSRHATSVTHILNQDKVAIAEPKRITGTGNNEEY